MHLNIVITAKIATKKQPKRPTRKPSIRKRSIHHLQSVLLVHKMRSRRSWIKIQKKRKCKLRNDHLIELVLHLPLSVLSFHWQSKIEPYFIKRGKQQATSKWSNCYCEWRSVDFIYWCFSETANYQTNPANESFSLEPEVKSEMLSYAA